MNLHLAGFDKLENIQLVQKTGHKFGLTSYYSMQTLPENRWRQHADEINQAGTSLILDSGLFTMMFGAGKDRVWDMPYMVEYTKRYVADARMYGFTNAVIVECDVHKILGMKAVFELRKIFKDSGMKTIYVWHVEEGIDGLLKLAQEEEYIAISVPELRKFFKKKGTMTSTAGVFDLLSKISRHCKSVGRHLPKIHLLGNTVQTTMKTHVAFSCDSTSWMSGARYGTPVVYRNGTLKMIHLRSTAFSNLLEKMKQERPEIVEFINGISSSEKRASYYLGLFLSADSYRRYNEWLNSHYEWRGR